MASAAKILKTRAFEHRRHYRSGIAPGLS